MKNKLLSLWSSYFYPFCDLEEIVPEFDIDSHGDFSKHTISSADMIKNNARRKNNLRKLKEKGGAKKFFFVWGGLTILIILCVDYIFTPTSLLEKLISIPFILVPYVFTLFFGLLTWTEHSREN